MAQNIPFGSGAAGVQWSETNNSFYTLPTNTQINGAIFIVAPFGPVNTPTYITSVQQLVQTFGTYSQGVGDGNLTQYPYTSQDILLSTMPLYVTRVGGVVSASTAVLTGSSVTQWNGVLQAAYPGSGGNEIQISNVSSSSTLNVYFNSTLVETYNYYNYSNPTSGPNPNIVNNINTQSNYINIPTSQSSNFITALATNLPLTYLSGGTDFQLASDGSDVANAINNSQLYNTSQYSISLIFSGGWSMIYPSNYGVINTALNALATSRRDAIVLGEAPLGTPVSQVQTQASALLNNSGYTAVYHPWVLVADPLSGYNVYMPPSLYAAPSIVNQLTRGTPWIAPAGKLRGQLSVIGLNQILAPSDRDTLYFNGINPIVNFVSEGIFIWGQKTFTSVRSALDRINARLTAIMIEKAVVNIASTFIFEEYTQAELNKFSAEVKTYMDGLKKANGIYDYLWSVNSMTSNPTLVDQHLVQAQLAFKPTQDIEYITINFDVTQYSVSFSEQ